MACHNVIAGFGISLVQWAWPDGRSYLRQPWIRVQAFLIFRSEAMAAVAAKSDAEHGRENLHHD